MLLNGRDVVLMSEGSKAPDFIEFLGAVREENPGQPIILLLDNAKITTPRVRERRVKG